jgi:hypothetical protein
MGQLGRRVDALEQIAEAARLRSYRQMAIDRGVPVDEFLAEAKAVQAFVDRLIGQGLTMDEIMARCAAHWEIPLDAIRTNSEATERRYVT